MIVEVTQEDIDSGVPMDPENCMLALAARRVLGPDYRVGSQGIYHANGVRVYLLSKHAQRAIDHFDRRIPVKPGRYRITERK